jgi:S1-C subfamily serine protease
MAKRFIIGFLFLPGLLALNVPVPAQGLKKDQEQNLYLRLIRSSTWIVLPKPAAPGKLSFTEGSGWVVSIKRKLVFTNYHVVGENNDVQVFFPYYQNNVLLKARKPYVNLIATGKGLPGKVIARDKQRDLAVIQVTVVPTWATTLPVATEGAKPGERVYNLGCPGGEESLWQWSGSTVLNVGKKRLHSKGENGKTLTIEARMVETDDVRTRGGQSGSLLVNTRGELVGVVQSISHKEPQTTMSIERADVLDFLEANKIKPQMGKKK